MNDNSNRSQKQNQTAQDDKRIGWYVVAFLDLLGQQDSLRQITALPNVDKKEDVDAFKLKVTELYSPLYALRTFFDTSIKTFTDGGIDINALPSDAQNMLTTLRSTPIFYQHFSDSIIANIPLLNDTGRFPCRAIYGVLAATAQTFLAMLSWGWAFRAGIDIGLAMNIGKDEIYGPALARAYRLESKIAKYPRIVIGEELVRYLNAVVGRPVSTDILEMSNSLLAKKSLDLLAIDDDGHSFIDYLGAQFRNQLQQTPQQIEIIQKAYNFIVQESSKHKEARNPKLGFRYTLLRNYFESRMPEWGFSFQRD